MPWPQVHELLATVARQMKHVLIDSASFVIQTSLDDFYVSYPLNAYACEASHQPLFTRAYTDTFETSSTRLGAQECITGSYTIPADYLLDYQAPKFRIEEQGKRENS